MTSVRENDQWTKENDYHFQRKLCNTSNITLDTLLHFNEEEYLFSVICYFLAHHLHGYKVQSLATQFHHKPVVWYKPTSGLSDRQDAFADQMSVDHKLTLN